MFVVRFLCVFNITCVTHLFLFFHIIIHSFTINCCRGHPFSKNVRKYTLLINNTINFESITTLFVLLFPIFPHILINVQQIRHMQMVFRPINIQFNCLVLLQMYNKEGNIYLIVCRFLERGLKREHE